MPSVGDGHRKLGTFLIGVRDITRDADDRFAARRTFDRDERELAIVVDLGKPRQHLRRQRAEVLHEAPVSALVRERCDKRSLHGGVLGANRAYAQIQPVQCQRRLELDGIGMDRHMAIAIGCRWTLPIDRCAGSTHHRAASVELHAIEREFNDPRQGTNQ